MTLSKDLLTTLYSNSTKFIRDGLGKEEKNNQDKEGKTLLHHAVLINEPELVKYLISIGVNLNGHDKIGWTVLHYAVQSANMEIVLSLIESGANPNEVDAYGNTILWRAVFDSKGKGEIIKLLLANEADPNLKNEKGISPIELSKKITNYNITQYFT